MICLGEFLSPWIISQTNCLMTDHKTCICWSGFNRKEIKKELRREKDKEGEREAGDTHPLP